MINHQGWTNTNSNIESFNTTIKRDYLQRKRLSVFGAVLKIEGMIIYYSKIQIIFNQHPHLNKELQIKANERQLSDFKSTCKHYRINRRHGGHQKKTCYLCSFFSF